MLSLIPGALSGMKVSDLERIKTVIRKAYPGVRQLSTDRLEEWMQRDGADLLLVDVRRADEFAVSHLHGAVNLQTAEQVAAAIKEPSQTVLYCSVGFRSSRLAHILTEHGVSGVMNLEGSIFQWANEDRAVYQGETRVQQVHPYGRRWAGLLRQGLPSD
jgi:rhodanese-related sulfurtransferase